MRACLAFALCQQPGYTGKAMALDHPTADIENTTIEAWLTVAADQHPIPPSLTSHLLHLLAQKAVAGRDYVREALALS